MGEFWAAMSLGVTVTGVVIVAGFVLGVLWASRQ